MGDWSNRGNIFTFSALSYSRTILDYLADDRQVWSVYSTHPHACNLRTPQSDLLALVSPRHGNGPFHIVLSLEALAEVSLRTATGPSLTSAHLRAMIQNAVIWEPQLPALPQHIFPENLLEQLQPYRQQLGNLLSTAGWERWGLATRLEEGRKLVESGIKTCDPVLTARGVEPLIGLGPGLTPLGDDWLIGFLGGLHLAAFLPCRDVIFAGFRQALQSKRTSQLSWLWLQYALDGALGEAWHELREALLSGTDERTNLALRRIAAQGATSGLAALSGLEQSWQSLRQIRV